MDIRDLRIFIAVAKCGSVTKAAEEMGYVQSNVTARIRSLESVLGTYLLYRHPRGVSLTSSGEVFLRYAQRIVALYQEAEEAVKADAEPTGPLRIGSMETTAATRLPDLLAKYHERFPKVDLLLHTGSTESLVQSVLNYEIEGAFVAGSVHHPSLVSDVVFDEELVLISQHRMDLQYLCENDHPTLVVFREGCTYRRRLIEWLTHTGIRTYRVMELGTVDGILGCVAAGMGISLVPRTVVSRSPYTLSIKELPEEFGRVPTVFVRRKDGYVSPALRGLLDLLRDISSKGPANLARVLTGRPQD